ncbi:MAG: AAA family ATPase [Anaerostipes sp.]|nr:AAA family ATPase [Anaerostipes sp.]MDD3745883.1 AAA family ATPase [Anaerostipes sp.]
MLKRKIEKRMDQFFDENQKALLLTGARQIGKTYIIRQYAKNHDKKLLEINFLENESAQRLFDNTKDSKDILRRISLLSDVPMEKGETIIFFDEVQECRELVTAIKFLVEEGSYQYILSGSLLGVELKDIRSVPVGYMDIYEMYPLDFEEFCMANGVSHDVIESLKHCFVNKTKVDTMIHDKMMELFRLYLIVGGMPEAVNTFLKNNNLRAVEEIQKGINRLYRMDIAKYDPENKLYLEEIFSLIPAELNAKNKRFILKNLNENFKFSRYENSFLWLKDAGVALPTYCASEPINPLLLSRATNMFKLFLSDIGLLAAMYMNGLQLKILNGEKDINFGSIYENVVAQELHAHGFDLFYYNNKKMGEVDFLVEYKGNVLPIEVKSGKSYTRHAALKNILETKNYGIKQGMVFCNENVEKTDHIVYYPIYMIMFLEREEEQGDMIYQPDFSILK